MRQASGRAIRRMAIRRMPAGHCLNVHGPVRPSVSQHNLSRRGEGGMRSDQLAPMSTVKAWPWGCTQWGPPLSATSALEGKPLGMGEESHSMGTKEVLSRHTRW